MEREIGITEQRAIEILNLKVLYKELIKMDKVTGIIEAREVKDVEGKGQYAGQTSQKISLKVKGVNYSTFSNSIPADVFERLGAVKQGDEIELSFIEKAGTFGGKAVTYRNITDIIKVTRTGESQFLASAQMLNPKEGTPVQPVGQKETHKSTGDSSRDDMMRLSYAKDTVNAVMTRGHLSPAEGESEELFLARVFSLIKAGAKTLGE